LSIYDEVGQEVAILEFHTFDELEDWVQTIEGLNFGLVNLLRREIVCSYYYYILIRCIIINPFFIEDLTLISTITIIR
jgi:hypothetical protein